MAAFCDIKLEACNLAATKPKHVFGKIKRQKCSLLTKPRKWLLSDRNRLKRCSECPQVKISVTRKKLEKKSIYWCNNAGKSPI